MDCRPDLVSNTTTKAAMKIIYTLEYKTFIYCTLTMDEKVGISLHFMAMRLQRNFIKRNKNRKLGWELLGFDEFATEFKYLYNT